MAQEGKTYRFELDDEEVFVLLQAVRICGAETVEKMRGAILRGFKSGEPMPFGSAEAAVGNCRKAFREWRRVHDKIVDQWCEQARDAGQYEDAEAFNHLKTGPEVVEQNLELFEKEIIKKAAGVRRQKLHIVK